MFVFSKGSTQISKGNAYVISAKRKDILQKNAKEK